MEYEHEIKFPAHYKPLPNNYKVIFNEFSEHYMSIYFEEESPIFCCRFMARQWCFNHYNILKVNNESKRTD